MTTDGLRLADLLSGDSARTVALSVVDQLSGRLVLTEDPHREDYEACRRSVSDIRHFLSSAATGASSSPDLRRSILRMREQCINFIRAAGSGSELYQRDHAMFVGNLTFWRLVMAQEIHWMCETYSLELPADMRRTSGR